MQLVLLPTLYIYQNLKELYLTTHSPVRDKYSNCKSPRIIGTVIYVMKRQLKRKLSSHRFWILSILPSSVVLHSSVAGLGDSGVL